MKKMTLVVLIMIVVLLTTAISCSGTTSGEGDKDLTQYIVPPASSLWVLPPIVNINNFRAGYVAEDMSPETFSSLYIPYVTYKVIDYDAKGKLGRGLSAYVYEYMIDGHFIAFPDEVQKAFPKSSHNDVQSALDELVETGCVKSYIDDPVDDVPSDKLYLIVHSGYSMAQDKFILTTFKNEHTANIPLKKALRDDDIHNVVNVATYPMQGGQNIAEKPLVLSYNAETNKLEIGNLAEDYKRIIEVDYHHDSPSTISLTYQVPDASKTWQNFAVAPIEAKSWVTLGETEVIMSPFETKAIGISLNAPKDATMPKNWEFQVMIAEVSSAQVTTDVRVRFLVTMASVPIPS